MKPNPDTKTVTFTIRVPAELRDSIPAVYTLNKFIVQAIREKLERDQRK